MNDARPRIPACEHDCEKCIGVLHTVRGQAARHRLDLMHEHKEHARLWRELRDAMSRTLSDLAPLRRAAGTPGLDDEFVRGWNQCVTEIEHRIHELQKVV